MAETIISHALEYKKKSDEIPSIKHVIGTALLKKYLKALFSVRHLLPNEASVVSNNGIDNSVSKEAIVNEIVCKELANWL